MSAFLIYHADDVDAVARFVDEFGSVFAAHTRGVTDGDDFVASPSDQEIIRAIRDRYVRDATIAIVLLGDSTWSRRFVDWEIAAVAGLHGDAALPLFLFDLDPQSKNRSPLPPRLARGGLPSMTRVDTPRCVRAMTNAVYEALSQTSARTRHREPLQDPLLRRNLL